MSYVVGPSLLDQTPSNPNRMPALGSPLSAHTASCSELWTHSSWAPAARADDPRLVPELPVDDWDWTGIQRRPNSLVLLMPPSNPTRMPALGSPLSAPTASCSELWTHCSWAPAAQLLRKRVKLQPPPRNQTSSAVPAPSPRSCAAPTPRLRALRAPRPCA